MTDTTEIVNDAMAAMQKNFEAMFPKEIQKQISAYMPKVTVSKNAYEIRAGLIEQAMAHAWQDYYAKLGHYEMSITKHDDEVVVNVEGPDKLEVPAFPKIPTFQDILEESKKLYDFVEKGK